MKRRDEILVGLLLMVSVVVALGGTIWIARGGLARNYAMYARFPWGAGLKKGQTVLLAGVQIGYVDNVALDPNGTLLVDMMIQQQYRVPKGSTATVEPNGIFGDQFIAVRPVIGIKEFMSPRDTIPTGDGPPGTAELLSKGDSIASDVRALTAKARSQFVEDGGLDEVRVTITQLSKLMTQISNVAAEQSAQLTRTQAAMRNTIAAFDSVKIDSTLNNLRSASASLAELSRNLGETNTQFQGVITKVNSGNGTIGKLMNDDAVYHRLDSLLVRMDSLVADIKKNPRKYINVRIF